MKITQELVKQYKAKFMAKIEEVGDCWEWQAGFNSTSKVPIFCMKHTSVTARRFAAELSGRDTDGRFVSAKCKNYRCVNPEHISVLSRKEHLAMAGRRVGQNMLRNQKIAEAKRAAAGKITMEQAEEIRSSTMTCKELSAIYGLNPSRISKIKTGNAWKPRNGFFTGLMK